MKLSELHSHSVLPLTSNSVFPAGCGLAFGRVARCLGVAAVVLALMSCLGGRAWGQLEELGIQNSNSQNGNNNPFQQQGQQQQQNNNQIECNDPDPANCAGASAGGGGLNTTDSTREPFSFQQPPGSNYLNGQGNYPERGQPRYQFRSQQPTEFQRYVGEATGFWLPIFGAELFQGIPSTFAPIDNAPVTPDYTIGPGDEILLQAWGQINFDLHLTVDRAGQIDIPRVGAVRVAGLKFSQLQSFLKTEIGKNFRNFDINANLGQLRTIQVFVVGQARRPGSYTLSSLSTLVNAVFAVGGPSANGSMRDVELRREGVVVTKLDLYDLLLRGDKSKDAQLLPGDVIYFPSAGPRVAVFGSVDRPAIYELTKDGTVDSALQLAGGLTAVASTQQAELERIQEHTLRHMLEVSLDTEGRAVKMQDGDVLRVFSFVPRFDNAIVLRGNVANPGRYAWKPGMKVSDLIPDQESLLTRDYWKQRAKLGLPVLDFQPLPITNPYADTTTKFYQRILSGNELNYQEGERASQAQGFDPNGGASGQQGQNGNRTPAPGSNNPYAQLNNGISVNQYSNGTAPPQTQTQAQGGQGNGNNTNQYRQNSGQAGLSVQGNASNESTLGANNGRLEQNSIGNATAAGASPPLPQNFPPKNIVELPAPDIDWSYAVVERMNKQTMKTELLPFRLGDVVMHGDPGQNLVLQAGDVVTVFSQADIRIPRQEQTRLVRIEGEVRNAGTYSVQPGETLRQLAMRAGGLSPDAYLYGASFTRESVRQQQQQRLDEYVTELASELQHSAAQTAVNSTSASDTAGAQVQSQSQQEAIAQLRSLRATGRIVLNLSQDAHDVSALPDVPLEDGDRLVVPALPSSVNVMGSVYNQSSFEFQYGRRAGDYLRQSGGPNRLADSKHEFIVRADGSVVSRSFNSGKLLSSFDSEPMNPGDTLIVPQKLITPSALRIFLDYTSVFTTLSLAAATLAALK